jgi:hypothetical protein
VLQARTPTSVPLAVKYLWLDLKHLDKFLFPGRENLVNQAQNYQTDLN